MSGVAFTPEVAEAARGAAPQLSHLAIRGCDMRSKAGSAQGVAAVLRHAAPHLQRLTLGSSSTFSPGLEAPLRLCSRLTSLELHAGRLSRMAGTLGSLAALPDLTTISLQGCKPSSAASAIAALTRLKELAWHGSLDESLLSAIARIRGLCALKLCAEGLRTSHLQLLSGLSALTRLTCDELKYYQPQRDAAVQLPPQLAQLCITSLVAPEAVAALPLAPALTRLVLGGFALPAPVGAESSRALVTACGRIAGRLDVGQRFELRLRNGPPPAPWASWEPLMEAMGPVGLRNLQLLDVQLTVADMASLSQHLSTLEHLNLECSIPVKALLCLPRLASLRRLTLWPNKSGDGTWLNAAALEMALLGLCMHAERLKDVTLGIVDENDDDDSDNEGENAVVKAAVDAVRVQLPLLRTSKGRLRIACRDM